MKIFYGIHILLIVPFLVHTQRRKDHSARDARALRAGRKSAHRMFSSFSDAMVLLSVLPCLEAILMDYIAGPKTSSTNYLSIQFSILYDPTGHEWDKTTLSSFYLLAIAQDRTIRSLRDLRKQHVPGNPRRGHPNCLRKYGLRNGSLRMYVHYQPSYCTLSFCPSIR